MKLTLIAVGRLPDYLQTGVDDYVKRIGRYLPFTLLELKEEKGGSKVDPNRITHLEGERILQRVPEGSRLILLDEGGKERSSEKLAAWLEQAMVDGSSDLTLVIGGAYGHGAELRKRSDETLSLSQLTLTHQMARLLLCEQLYRALTIIRNEPYHNR